ncbi:amidohydrolase family protein [Cyclobacterium jeungdonense]|uniref:Amidohydrolase family protein n=1 Tax=Cyclobacterium jeungdonense TaxID=708087 RepID=A0ABT8CEY2_9BACT|nr:amidohydrolase family protein [Cyclobacterium jeungdonense]MDN3690148.1 amidohydrolase family protein [Cyclobacterium jeungdonense]
MAFSNKKWVWMPISFLLFLGLAYWLIGKIQYRLNVMDVEEYAPVSTLKVPEHLLTSAKYPFVDVHNHQFTMPIQNLDKLVQEMDDLNMAVMVNLSGFRGKYLEWSLNNVNEKYSNRFILFMNLDFEKLDDEGWPNETLTKMEEAVKMGVKGLKVYKTLGLTETDNEGNRIQVDDPRLDPIWAKCGELGIPVLIHTGEPPAFWLPKDKHNERWLELKQYPSRYKDPEANPSFEEVMAEQHNVFRKHPNTKFIAAHLGWFGNDLARLGNLLDEMPNVYTELGAVLAELGRQPVTARAWLIAYQDRVMMGKDAYNKEEYYTYFRVLETSDEYFDYYRKRHAHWKMYGLALPDAVLRKIYYKNAIEVIPGIDTSLFEMAEE